MPVRGLEIGKLYESENVRLLSLVRRIVGNREAAEDVVHQAFANILAKVDGAAPPSSAYVSRAVQNLAFNYLRDLKRRADFQLAQTDMEQVADPQPTPETIALYRSELRKLLEAVAALPNRRRQAFLLNRIEGLSYDEIADRMAISRNTVISLVVAAMADLDRRL